MATDMIMLSEHVYGGPNAKLPEGWDAVSLEELKKLGLNISAFSDPDSGFNAQLYKNKDGKYVLIFEGTKMKSLKDWRTNVEQGLGKETEQYNKAMELSILVSDAVEPENLTLGGHSLGGGLASAGAAATGCDTYTYNPAGLHPKTVERAGYSMENTSHVQSFYSQNDILNMGQDNREIIGGGTTMLSPKTGRGILLGDDLPRAAGQRIGIDTGVFTDPITGHGIGEGKSGLLETLKNERDSLPPSGMVKIYADEK